MTLPALYIVTGASRGLGEAFTRLLLQRTPVHVLAIARHANAQLAQLADETGARLDQWQFDLRDAKEAGSRVLEWLAQPDRTNTAWREVCLINNAATLPTVLQSASDTSSEAFETVLQVGLHAPIMLTSRFLEITQDWPAPRKVLNLSSGLARSAMASTAAYSTAKAGVDHFTRCLAREEERKPNGARVCALAPGVVDTDMQQQMRESAEQDFPDAKNFRFLHASGRLTSVETAASRMLALLDSPTFGSEPISELRAEPRAESRAPARTIAKP